ncbi:hypothetical protein HYH03_012295 [Edaphochlamys debaryana]|uniref:Uncharacterized protein n=1 Tax=Edaphochlamys debaryana TaxID=47281 RepID=A0A835XYM6_9CHLO|nr:hypothetical protein HYH03_012295 [Edaphochlamys debaryana]|eukprot:KAG2489275.1 hypothetical protein HYH03_012295 [Edaphochlamys debaryana]
MMDAKNYTLGPGDLRRSLMNCCNARMVALLKARGAGGGGGEGATGRGVEGGGALEEGRAVTVAVVGGSFSLPDHISSHDVWFSLWLKWLTARYPQAKIKGINACVGASSAGLSFLCLREMLPEPVDLVFVDYTPNMSPKLEIEAKDLYLEQLLRALLGRPEQPLVVGIEQMLPEPVFYKTAEVTTAPLYQFYDVPWVSVRNALFHRAAANKSGFGATQTRIVTGGRAWHYNRRGHRLVADLAVHFLRAAGALAAQGLLGGQEDPFWQDGEEGRAPLHRMLRPHPVRRPLGCVLAPQLPRFVAPASSAGWAYTTDDPNGAKWGFISAYGAREPPAFNTSGGGGGLPAGVVVSATPPRLDLEWDPRDFGAGAGSDSGSGDGQGSGISSTGGDGGGGGSYVFVLSYLASYAQTGYGNLSCSGACSCRETSINAYMPEHSLTLVRPVVINFTQPRPQAEGGGGSVCRVSLANVSPGGRRWKFKVLGFILAELEPGMEADVGLVSFMWHGGALQKKSPPQAQAQAQAPRRLVGARAPPIASGVTRHHLRV